MLFNNSPCQIEMFATRFEDISPQSQQKALVDIGGLFKGEESVHTALFYRLANTDNELCYGKSFTFGSLYSHISNRNTS